MAPVAAWNRPFDWVGSGWGFRAASNESLMYALSRIGTHQSGKRYVWRGVSDASLRMSSSLWRYVADQLGRLPSEVELREREVSIIESARQWGIGADQGLRPTEFHIAAQLQHEGVRTRLLDVTSNPMTALWFACAAQTHKPGVLFALEVSNWRSVSTTETYGDTWGGIGGKNQIDLAVSSSPDPLLVIPRNATGRLATQEGLFVTSRVAEENYIAGLDGLSLAAKLKPPGKDVLDGILAIGKRGQGHPRTLPFVAIVIPARVKKSMISHLGSTYNRSRQSLFPDVGGFRAAFDLGEIDQPGS